MGSALAILFGLAPLEVRAWSDDVFDTILKRGGWHEAADDKILGETLTSDVIKTIVTRYRARPSDRHAQQDLGLLALTLGVAEWGIADTAGLPPDPRGKGWASDTGIDSGKHLMSYAVGGIGISHADVGDLEKFIALVAGSEIVPAQHRPALLRLADKSLYARHQVIYDDIRAAGRCATTLADSDLLGSTFDHFKGPAGSSYCSRYANKNLTEHDWRVFRTWMRAALRTRKMQEWLASLWMDKYWTPSLAKVPQGPGFIEEVIINARLRNSAPTIADQAVARTATTVTEHIQRELDAYGAWSMKTLKRRCRIMLRPVVLYRHFAGEPPLQDIRCPQGSA